MNLLNPFVRSRSPPTDEHLAANPVEFNPFRMLTGNEQFNQISPTSANDCVTKLCDIPASNKFALVTAYNIDWHGESEEQLQSDPALFRAHFVTDEGLADGSLIFEPKTFCCLSFNEFEIVINEPMVNFNFQIVENVDFLTRTEARGSILTVMAKHCKQLRRDKRIIKNELKASKRETNELNKGYQWMYTQMSAKITNTLSKSRNRGSLSVIMELIPPILWQRMFYIHNNRQFRDGQLKIIATKKNNGDTKYSTCHADGHLPKSMTTQSFGVNNSTVQQGNGAQFDMYNSDIEYEETYGQFKLTASIAKRAGPGFQWTAVHSTTDHLPQ